MTAVKGTVMALSVRSVLATPLASAATLIDEAAVGMMVDVGRSHENVDAALLSMLLIAPPTVARRGAMSGGGASISFWSCSMYAMAALRILSLEMRRRRF